MSQYRPYVKDTNGEILVSSYIVPGTAWNGSQITFSTTTTTNDTINITNHGLVNGDTVGFGVSANPNNSGTIPWCGQYSATRLYVINATTDTFQVSTTNGGSALSFTTIGSSEYKLFKNTGIVTINFDLSSYKRARMKMRGWSVLGTTSSRPSIARNGNTGITTRTVIPSINGANSDYFYGSIDLEYSNIGNSYSFGFIGSAHARAQVVSSGVSLEYKVWNYGHQEASDTNSLGTISFTIYGAGFFGAGTVIEVYALE